VKVLIVDDSSLIRKIVKSVTNVLQMDTLEAQDGVEALQVLEEHYHDICLVLLDWNMPIKNGYDVLVDMRRIERYQHIPVMMVTTESQKTSIIAAVRAGANNYLTKPFTVQELESKILECLES